MRISITMEVESEKLTVSLLRAATLGTIAVTVPTLTSALATPAWGQASDLGGVTQTITLRATVKAIDLRTERSRWLAPGATPWS
jgi:hypothetical protein